MADGTAERVTDYVLENDAIDSIYEASKCFADELERLAVVVAATEGSYHRDVPRLQVRHVEAAIVEVAGRHEAIQLALCSLSPFGNDPDKVAETHPGVAGALRVLLPYAKPRTRYAIGLDPPQPEWLEPAR